MREESQFVFQNGLGSSNGNLSNILVAQAIPDSKKTENWKKNNMDTFERIAQKQFRENLKFKDYYDMIEGRLTYLSSGLGDYVDMSPFRADVKKISEDKGIPTYLKHYDFIGIVVNALVGLYMDFQDVFRVDSNDEYFTNDYIRYKTELLYKYAQETFQAELQRLLVGRGIDINKNDFETQEEYDQYQQQIAEQKKALTPPEIEIAMAKNFKILATEWAQNTLKADESDFDLYDLDKLNFIDKLLTGRFFRHYDVKYDSYDIERWKPANTFFSQTTTTRYPQEGEYVGHIDFMSPSDIINKFGYLLTAKQQESLSNYWGQKDNTNSVGSGNYQDGFFQRQTVPFNNYYDHQLLSQYESALGVPMGNRTLFGKDGVDDQYYRDWLPQYGASNQLQSNLAGYHRDDITVDTSAIQVTQAYWRSYKRMGLLIYENDQGAMSMTVVTDDLLPEFITRYEIKKLKEVTLDEVERAIKANRLNDYINTIVYNYTPEIWKGIKIKNTSQMMKEDIYLDVRPLDFQIRGGRSNVYNFLHPVGGIIGNSLVMKMTPYQIMHNMLMNQMQDITEKEIGMFFIMDVNFLPSEFLQGGNQHSNLLELREFAKDVGFLPVDKSKQNAPTSQNVNTFERIDLSYGQQLEYKRALAEFYKQEGLKQIGVTPQMLGNPNTYTTAEGVKQGAQASFIQIQQIFEEMNSAKCKMMDIHLAVAQYCQCNGKDNTVLTTKGDGDHYFLDIVKEDEHFSMRSLGVKATTSSKDRKILETARQILTSDNTISKDLLDITNILTDTTIVELRHNAQIHRDRIEAQTQAQQQHEKEMQQNALDAQKKQIQHAEDIRISEAQKDRDSKEQIAYMTGISKAVDDNGSMEGLQYLKMENDRTSKLQEIDAKMSLKEKELQSQQEQNKMTTAFKFQELADKTKLKREEFTLRREENNSKTFRDINSYN
jgi:hypothetical protein